ncbi:substrate-binding domain-containing protein [Methylobacterium crusticola]|uniref:substrate-binding domain-containing protein n=1 Tax=Methylobacterium crusticola TaxID=1697972 RepID=UPI0022AB45EA|nr:substrate-binding domain-containing protein [Methylobacterium crusticola]
MLPDVSNSFFSDIARRIELLAYERDMRVVTCNSDYDRDREQAYIDDFVGRRVDGLIIAPTISDPALDATLQAAGLPAVLIDRVAATSVLPSVAIDNRAAAALAADHLYALGHRRIGCITAHPGMAESVDQRTQGFVERVRALTGALEPGPVAYADFRLSGGLYAATRLLEERGDLTALFCANDVMAVGAIRAVTASGRRVPDDLSVMGFDDSLEARIAQPLLTSVSQPLAAMAEAAMDLLREGGEPARIVLKAELVIRESTARCVPATRPGRVVTLPRRRSASAELRSVVLAGAGQDARRFATALSAGGGIALAGVFDASGDRADELALSFGARSLSPAEARRALDDVDALLVTCDAPECLALIEEAVRRHVHVLCRPSAAALPVLDSSFARGQSSAVFQAMSRLRLDPAAVRIAHLVEAGEIGSLLSLRLTRHGGPFDESSPGALPLIEDFDLIRFVTGQEGAEIVALDHRQADADAAPPSRAVAATMRLSGGCLATLERLGGPTLPPTEHLAVVGTTGSLEAAIGLESTVLHRQGGRAWNVQPWEAVSVLAEKRQLAAFAAAIGGRLTDGFDMAALRVAVTLADAATQSLRQGRAVGMGAPDPGYTRRASQHDEQHQ